MLNRNQLPRCSAATAFCFCLAACAMSPKVPATAQVSSSIKLSDAVSLDDLQVEGREVSFTDKLSKPAVDQPIFFGEIDQFADDDSDSPTSAVPIIAVKKDGTWLAVPIGGDGLTNAGWKYVGTGPGDKEIWGVLDTVAGKSRSRFVLAHSSDSGVTFQLTIIKKPTREAEFFDFAMDDSGHGRATLSLDKTIGESKAGLYHFETSDNGKTWTDHPRFEADVMKRADTVPDEEQPDQPATKSRTAFKSIASNNHQKL